MILLLNEVRYEYDIRGLITAFYPGMALESKTRDFSVYEDSVFKALSLYGSRILEDKCDFKDLEDISEFISEGKPEGIGELPEDGDNFKLFVFYGKGFTSICVFDCDRCYKSAAFYDDCHINDVSYIKNQVKRMVYGIFAKLTGKELLWGTLSGIRPVKLPMAMIEEGLSDEETEIELKKKYFISDEKSKLSIKIAHKEHELLEKLDYEDGYSMYVGIPFCPTTCLYCSFTSYPFSKWEKRISEYVDALLKELSFTAEYFKGKKLNTIYFGGGTPTTLPPVYLNKILSYITENFDLSDLVEWTVEGGRPDSITPEKLAVIRKYPVDRISINPQTMKQETLDIIGRRHTVEDVKKAFKMAREAGFDNINMDLIIGLPKESNMDVSNTIEEIEKLNPDNLTVHTLAIKRASRLNIEKEKYGSLYLEQNTDTMMNITAEGAKNMGMEPYYLYRQKNMSGNLENVGYARQGKEGIYNILIMEEKQSIVALGAGAVTKKVGNDGIIERASNVKDVEQYITRIDEMIERKKALFSL